MISVCYSGNKAIFEGLLMSVMSVAKFTDDPVCIYVLTMDLHEKNPKFLPFSTEQIALLDKIVKEKNHESSVIKCDVTDLYKKYMGGGETSLTITLPTPFCAC